MDLNSTSAENSEESLPTSSAGNSLEIPSAIPAESRFVKFKM